MGVKLRMPKDEVRRLEDGSLTKVFLFAEAPEQYQEFAPRGEWDYLVVSPRVADQYTATLVAEALACEEIKVFTVREHRCYAVGRKS